MAASDVTRTGDPVPLPPPAVGTAGGRLLPPPLLHQPLLDSVVAEALDPAYADAARRRSTRPPRARAVAAGLLLVGGLGVGLTLAQGRGEAPVAEQTRTALLGDVQSRTGRVEQLADQVDALRQETTRLQQSLLTSTAAGRGVAAQRAALSLVAGEVAVTGPGVAVDVDDAPAAATGRTSAEQRPDGATASGRVRDRDLQDVVNALWAAGAEAVAVGGIRLSPTTAIRTAGQTILADYRPLRSPYVILAVGDPDRLPGAFRDAGAGVLARLREQGSPVRVTSRATLELPAARGNDLRVAQPLGPAGSATTSASSGQGSSPSSSPSPSDGSTRGVR